MDSGATLWHASLLGPGAATSDPRGCEQITPEIGVTSTPVIDQDAGGRDHFGAGNKFITPTIADGKVLVGTTTGVGAFGLLHCGSEAGRP